MTSGTFQVGETVIGRMVRPGLGPIARIDTRQDPRITFRVAQSNHREGEYNAPDQVFRESPYDGTAYVCGIFRNFNILNVDTFSLSNEAQGEYSGRIEEGMILRGTDKWCRSSHNRT